MHRHRLVLPLSVAVSLTLVLASTVAAHDHLDDGLEPNDPSEPLIELDLMQENIISEGPTAKVTKNLAIASHGERLRANATTDVWALDGFAYIGTFNVPCGGSEPDGLLGPGVQVFNVKNPNKARYVATVPSQVGSRINDVKVANMNSGAILVHSNETCGPGGMGGFEVYNVDDPRNPVHLAGVRVHEANETLRAAPFNGVNRGVHNLFLFTQDDRDYVAMQTHAWFGGLQIFDLTDPTDPELVVAWGAELLCEEAYCSEDPYNETDATTLVNHINGFMFCDLTPCFGASQNRFLHDVTVSAAGNLAYLSHWDAGLILLDISDPTDPLHISTALDPENGSLDGEVNSHAAWPTADGSVVVETEEDFSAWETIRPLGNFTFGAAATNTIPGVGISTSAGDDFEANQTGNNVTVTATSVTVNSGPLAGNVYPAIEGAGDQPRIADTGPITNDAVWIGQACDVDPILNAAEFAAGNVAVVRRGACTFAEKLKNAAAIGASAIVIANNVEGSTPWGGVRIWDYSDPTNPVLASTFDTVCSSLAVFDSSLCDARGTYSVHNVIVEGNKAYFSWYSDGVLVVDISDPYNPVEVARYHEAGPDFEARNGGIQDVWGIYKEPDKPWIYASDRNGGLYVLKEHGSGSKKNKP